MRRKLAFTGLMLGMASSIIMQTVLATVLPQIALEMGDVHLYGWVFSGYMLASTVAIPLFSKLADVYGRKMIYLGGMLLFIAGMALSIGSQNLGQLVFYRVIQGIGASAMIPAATAMISDLYPHSERGQVFGLLTTIQALANMVGPLLGGLAADLWMWQGAIILNLPPCLLAFFLISFYFQEQRSQLRSSLNMSVDYTGSLLLGSIMLALLITVEQFATPSVVTADILPLLAFNAFLLLLFRLQLKRHPDPIIPSSLLNSPHIRLSLLGYFIWGMITYGTIISLPLYGQALWGAAALQGGKMLLALTIGLGAGGILCTFWLRPSSFAPLLKTGWALILGGFILLGITSPYPLSFPQLFPLLLITGIGLGVISPLLMLATQNNASPEQRAVMGGFFFICRNLGGALGVTLFTAVITSFSFTSGVVSDPSPFALLFILSASLAALGLYWSRGFLR